MVRRLSTLLAAISMMLLLYLVAAGLLINRILQWVGAPIPLTGPRRPLPTDFQLFGYPIPPLWPVALLSIAPAWWIACTIYFDVQRHHRQKHSLCPDCGYPLPSLTRGKCPDCGLRIGPG